MFSFFHLGKTSLPHCFLFYGEPQFEPPEKHAVETDFDLMKYGPEQNYPCLLPWLGSVNLVHELGSLCVHTLSVFDEVPPCRRFPHEHHCCDRCSREASTVGVTVSRTSVRKTLLL